MPLVRQGSYRSGTDAANRYDPPLDRLFTVASMLHAVHAKYYHYFKNTNSM